MPSLDGLGEKLSSKTQRELLLFGAKDLTYNEKVLETGPIGFWPLNEAAGPTVNDISGNGFNGTYLGTVGFGNTGIGDGDTAVQFRVGPSNDGRADVFSAALGTAFDNDLFTMMLWHRVLNISDYGLTGTHNLIKLVSTPGGGVIIQFASAPGNYEGRRSGDLILNHPGVDTNWASYILRGEAGQGNSVDLQFFKNGANPQTDPVISARADVEATALIGGDPTNIDGYFAKAAVWDRFLSDAEVASVGVFP